MNIQISEETSSNKDAELKNPDKKSIPLFWKVSILIAAFITVILGIAIVCEKFANWYRAGIFRGAQYIMGHISGIFPISVGEIMIYLAIIMVVILIAAIIAGFFKYPWCKNFRKYYIRVAVCVLLYAYATEAFNCFVLYRAETLEERFVRQGADYDKNTMEALKNLHQDIVKKLNELSETFSRDEEGYISLTKEQQKEYQKKSQDALKNISEEFSLLKGYYPDVKMISSSDFMTQQYLLGVYFPFSMEANYNKNAYITNMPATYCHELSHMKGYILEDEANFIAYIACISSDDKFVQYSGYMSILVYVERDLLTYLTKEEMEEMEWPNELVCKDDIFVKREIFEEIEKNAVFSTDFISDATDVFLDTNLKLNGVSDGMISYSQVVKLVLLYEQLEH